MKVSNAVKLCLEYHKSHSKENTVRAYKMILTQLCEEFEAEKLENTQQKESFHS
jgi:hypothetical protein